MAKKFSAALRELWGAPPILPSEIPDARGSLASCATWPYSLGVQGQLGRKGYSRDQRR